MTFTKASFIADVGYMRTEHKEVTGYVDNTCSFGIDKRGSRWWVTHVPSKAPAGRSEETLEAAKRWIESVLATGIDFTKPEIDIPADKMEQARKFFRRV